MEYLENELDKINRYYRHKLVNIITIPPIYNISPDQIPIYFSGIFMEASEIGIWLMYASGDRKGKTDFYYHDKVIKIEEAGKIDINDLDIESKNKIKEAIKNYENKRKEEIEEYNKNVITPDIKDPSDQNGINEMLTKVQEMVLENKKNQEKNDKDFLLKRQKPQQ